MTDHHRGFLVTFKPCGHVQHSRAVPAEGLWLSCWQGPRGHGCQTPRQVAEAVPCPGCPDCWRQPTLPGFGAAA
jgi:hypothetical protein